MDAANMDAALWVSLAVSGTLGAAGPWLARCLPPATAVRLLSAAMLASALATGFVLSVAGILVVAQVPVIADLGHWSVTVMASGAPLSVMTGGLAGVTVSVLLAASLRHAARTVCDLVTAALVCRRLGPDAAGLVVVEDDAPDAYALPGMGGRVVVSTAMLRALPADERQVLLAHEVAHLRHRHHFYVQVAELAAAANPLLRPAARAVGAAVERWADEIAAAEVGDRRLAARALARAGLARAAARRRPGPAAALAGVDGQVAQRVKALLAGPPRRRRGLAAVLAALMLTAVASALVTAESTENRFESAQSAYTAVR